MSIGLLFWILFVLWIVLGIYRHRNDWSSGGGDLILAALIFLLGWQAFGFIVHN